jgi:hypothetical protein
MKLAKTNTELINVKGDLSNTRMDLINKLGMQKFDCHINCWIAWKLGGKFNANMFLLHIGTRIELVQTKIDLEKTMAKTVDDLTVKLNGTLLLYWKIWNHKQNVNKTLFFKWLKKNWQK